MEGNNELLLYFKLTRVDVGIFTRWFFNLTLSILGGIVEQWANALFTASQRCQGSRVRNSSSPLLFSLQVDDYEFSLAPVHHEKEKSRGRSRERKNDRRLR